MLTLRYYLQIGQAKTNTVSVTIKSTLEIWFERLNQVIFQIFTVNKKGLRTLGFNPVECKICVSQFVNMFLIFVISR